MSNTHDIPCQGGCGKLRSVLSSDSPKDWLCWLCEAPLITGQEDEMTYKTFKGYEIDPSTAKAVMRAKQGCPHCHSKAEPVNCHRCNRDMCKDCISMFGGAPVCGSCYDELNRHY